jgi:hypothetical protein
MIADIRKAIEAAIVTMRVANGFTVDIIEDNVKQIYNAESMSLRSDGDYPKVFVMLQDGTNEAEPSSRYFRTAAFVIVFVLKRLIDDVLPLKERVENAVDDFHRLFAENSTLSGLIQNCHLENYTTDSGVADPEGIAVMRVAASYYLRQ